MVCADAGVGHGGDRDRRGGESGGINHVCVQEPCFYLPWLPSEVIGNSNGDSKLLEPNSVVLGKEERECGIHVGQKNSST